MNKYIDEIIKSPRRWLLFICNNCALIYNYNTTLLFVLNLQETIVNKKIIISLIFLASSTVNLMCSQTAAPIRESLKQQSIVNDIMASLNKVKQDINKLQVSMEGKPGNKAVKFALRNLMKMLDMFFSQTVKLAKFFIPSDAKVDTNIQKSSKRVEAEEDSQSLENGLEAPLLSETLKKQEKEEKKEKQRRKGTARRG